MITAVHEDKFDSNFSMFVALCIAIVLFVFPSHICHALYAPAAASKYSAYMRNVMATSQEPRAQLYVETTPVAGHGVVDS